MYSLISKWTILQGKEIEAIHILKKLAKQVQEKESDTLVYLVHTPDLEQTNLPTPPAGEVIFFEIYKDQTAFNAHVNGPVFSNFVKEYSHFFLCNLGKPYVTLELLKHQAGFIRDNIILESTNGICK